MGTFYVNFTVRGASQAEIVAALAGREAAVTPEDCGCVVAVDEQADEQDPEIMSLVGALLSKAVRKPVLAVLNHDDDLLAYQLFIDGELADAYTSCPDYFDHGESSSPPVGGDAHRLCAAFQAQTVHEVGRVLRLPWGGDEIVFESDRHAALVRLLGISEYALGLGFTYVSRGEFPPRLDPSRVRRCGKPA
jgi:hypothetical protein